MKKLLFVSLFVLSSAGLTFAQTTYEESQARIIEPLQDVYVRPLVADLVLVKEGRQHYGPFEFYKGTEITKMTYQMIDQAKINSVFKAGKIDQADVIVGATFNIRNAPKGGGILVELYGYPAKYTNFRKVGEEQDDYKWIPRLLESSDLRTSEEKKEAVVQ